MCLCFGKGRRGIPWTIFLHLSHLILSRIFQVKSTLLSYPITKVILIGLLDGLLLRWLSYVVWPFSHLESKQRNTLLAISFDIIWYKTTIEGTHTFVLLDDKYGILRFKTMSVTRLFVVQLHIDYLTLLFNSVQVVLAAPLLWWRNHQSFCRYVSYLWFWNENIELQIGLRYFYELVRWNYQRIHIKWHTKCTKVYSIINLNFHRDLFFTLINW